MYDPECIYYRLCLVRPVILSLCRPRAPKESRYQYFNPTVKMLTLCFAEKLFEKKLILCYCATTAEQRGHLIMDGHGQAVAMEIGCEKGQMLSCTGNLFMTPKKVQNKSHVGHDPELRTRHCKRWLGLFLLSCKCSWFHFFVRCSLAS